MDFLIADTFTASLGRLTNDEQKAVKTTAFDLQLKPADPGMRFHRLEKAKDHNFWSVRVSSDLRVIVHRTTGSLLLCYVDHHDKAYAWAERRKLETHPRTGAAQLVEIRETVRDSTILAVPAGPPTPAGKPDLRSVARPLFADRDDEELLAFGVPQEWLGDVRAATEDSLLALADHLPAEAAEALLEVATGGRPRSVQPAGAVTAELPRVAEASAGYASMARATPVSGFAHPDAQRRFRLMSDVEELERALDAPWERWTVFLHPQQRLLVQRDYAGPARVAGSAGTGKTIVALHRAVHIARAHPDARVLLTTFSDALANALHARLRRLISNTPRLAERIDVHSLDTIGLRLYKVSVRPGHVPRAPGIGEAFSAARESRGRKPDGGEGYVA